VVHRVGLDGRRRACAVRRGHADRTARRPAHDLPQTRRLAPLRFRAAARSVGSTLGRCWVCPLRVRYLHQFPSRAWSRSAPKRTITAMIAAAPMRMLDAPMLSPVLKKAMPARTIAKKRSDSAQRRSQSIELIAACLRAGTALTRAFGGRWIGMRT